MFLISKNPTQNSIYYSELHSALKIRTSASAKNCYVTEASVRKRKGWFLY